MIGVFLIGAGRIGKLHANNLLANPKAKIVSVYDPHPPSAQAIASLAVTIEEMTLTKRLIPGVVRQ